MDLTPNYTTVLAVFQRPKARVFHDLVGGNFHILVDADQVTPRTQNDLQEVVDSAQQSLDTSFTTLEVRGPTKDLQGNVQVFVDLHFDRSKMPSGYVLEHNKEQSTRFRAALVQKLRQLQYQTR